MWGGRFAEKPAALMQAINVSIGFDKRLWREDLAGSRAHAAMLHRVGVLSSSDHDAIQAGLNTIQVEIEAGTFPYRDEFEDIHMNVEARLCRADRRSAARAACTPRARATIRWPSISACTCAMRVRCASTSRLRSASVARSCAQGRYATPT